MTRQRPQTVSGWYRGPPVRPVCGAAASYSNRLSHMVSTILTELWISKEDGAVCISTEGMIAEMKKVNSVQVDNDLVVGSADVKALYPSLDMDFTIEKVCDVFFESDIQIEGVDYEEAGLYLTINIEPEVLQTSNIADVCPTRKSKRGRKPTITASGAEERKEKRFKSWNPPKKQAGVYTKRLILVVSDHEEPCVHSLIMRSRNK